MTEESLRSSLRVVITGHVDHGKSTVIGRLLVETGALPQGKLERIRSYCERNSKPFEYAFLLDALKDEQAQGITVEASRIFFKTPLRDYIVVDAPGHVEFLKNMVSGASQASAALLVLDAKEGVRENSRRHGYLLSMLGIRQIAVLVNKMDLVGHREEAFLALAAEYRAFLSRIGVTAAHFIPVSGLHGDNLARRSPRMPWYHGSTVLEALDSFSAEPSLSALPFRMPVQGVYKFTNESDARRVVVGSAESGSLSVGDEVVFYPSGKSSSVRAIEEFPATRRTRIFAGMATGFSLADEIYVRRGEIAARREDPPPRVATRFRTRLIWLGREPLAPGKDYILKAGTARVTARLGEITRVLDSSSLETRERATNIARHEAADCVLETSSAIAFDLADENAACGRFVIVDDFEICGGGLIQEALPQKRPVRRRGRTPALVLVTGARDSQRKVAAQALESGISEGGRSAYFLGIGNSREDIRRLAEIARIIMDSGLILIVSVGELRQDGLDVIRAQIGADRIETVWVGAPVTTDLVPDALITETRPEDAAAAILSRLRRRGFLSS